MGAEQGTQAWLDERKGKLTASVFGQAAGLGPSSRQALWRRFMGIEEREFNEAFMAYGIEHEPIARSAYMQMGTHELCEQTGFVVHPEHEWLGASPDLLVGGEGLCEIKCPANKVIYEDIPTYYMAQMQGQMEVTDREWCDFAVWTPEKLSVRRVMRSVAYWRWLHLRLADFWVYVMAACEPPRMARRIKPPDMSEFIGAEIVFDLSTPEGKEL